MTASVTGIRLAHRELTREAIVEAAVELMAERMDTAIPTADIAARAGVTERTVYRHFTSREQLAQAVWPRVVARMQEQRSPATAADLVRLPQDIFPLLDRSEGLIRAAVYSPVAREAARQTNAPRQAAMLACADEALDGLGTEARRRRAAVLLMVSSAYGWAVLRDFGGLSGDEAALAASEAIGVLLGLRAPDDNGDLPQRENQG